MNALFGEIMTSSNTRPKWWQVYLTLPLLVALLVVDSRLKISTRGHQWVQIGIILLIYGFVHMWLKANASALSEMDRLQAHGTFTVIQIPDKDHRPMLRVPDSELKNVLSNIFELDYIEAELLPRDEIPQESGRE
jgi:hypothetical protein